MRRCNGLRLVRCTCEHGGRQLLEPARLVIVIDIASVARRADLLFALAALLASLFRVHVSRDIVLVRLLQRLLEDGLILRQQDEHMSEHAITQSCDRSRLRRLDPTNAQVVSDRAQAANLKYRAGCGQVHALLLRHDFFDPTPSSTSLNDLRCCAYPT